MTTSPSRSNTSAMPSSNLNATKPTFLPKRHLNHASRPMATIAAATHSSPTSPTTSSALPRLQRERFLVQHSTTGQYLSGAVNGKLTWTDNPLEAFRYTLMETVMEQVRATREFYNVPDVQVASIVFSVDPSNPDRMDAWNPSAGL